MPPSEETMFTLVFSSSRSIGSLPSLGKRLSVNPKCPRKVFLMFIVCSPIEQRVFRAISRFYGCTFISQRWTYPQQVGCTWPLQDTYPTGSCSPHLTKRSAAPTAPSCFLSFTEERRGGRVAAQCHGHHECLHFSSSRSGRLEHQRREQRREHQPVQR